jgi:predicted TIM-barrel fold metal-dependent hydrolase
MRTIHDATDVAWPDEVIPVIDAHHHLWNLSAGHYPWLQDEYDEQHFFLGPYKSICKDFLPADYRAVSSRHPVVATVHIEAERDRAEQLAETIWLHEISAEHRFPNAVVPYVSFVDPDVGESLAQQASYPLVRGIRCKPATTAAPGMTHHTLSGTMHDPLWLAGLALLEKHRFSWDLRVPSWHLDDAAEVARQFPRIPIALNHAGLPWDRSEYGLSQWRRSLERLADNPNVAIKLSEFGVRGQAWNPVEVRDVIRQAIDVFGASRCMFASNFSVSSVKTTYDNLLATFMEAIAFLPRPQRTAVMAFNAAKFYRIPIFSSGPTQEI